MKRAGTIIKINILALVALPMLLLSTAIKLLAKAMEKLLLIFGIVIITAVLALILELMKTPGETLQGILMLILCLVIGGIFTAVFVWILSLISSVVMVGVTVVIGVFNVLYELVYKGYAVLYRICKRDYGIISREGSPFLNGLCCLIYSLLRGVNRLLILFVTHALKLAIAACVLIAGYSLLDMNAAIRRLFGVNLFRYLGLFSGYEIISGILLYLVVMVGICVVLVSLGIEWNEWGMEMRISTFDYEKYADRNEYQAQFDMDESAIADKKQMEKYQQYLNRFHTHMAEFEAFMKETEEVADGSENYLFRTARHEYIQKLTELAEKMKGFGRTATPEQLDPLLPWIEQLDKQKEDLIRQMERERRDQEAAAGGFFAGCTTESKLEKRYKALCKTYHPDMEAGDEETFKKIQAEYEKKKEEIERNAAD